MKKAIALLLASAIFIALAGCDVKEQILDNTTQEYYPPAETRYENLVLDAERESLRSLLSAHKKFIEEVFVLSHLPVDESQAITHNGARYAPVKTEASIKSYESLISNLNAVYTEDVVNKMIGNPPVYMELDGVFYYNLDYKSEFFNGEAFYPYSWSKFDIIDNHSMKYGDRIDFVIEVLDASKTDGGTVWISMDALNVDGAWKLCDFYYIVK